MTWDDNSKLVRGIGSSYRTYGLRVADPFSHVGVTESFTGFDLSENVPDFLLKGCSLNIQWYIKTTVGRID